MIDAGDFEDVINVGDFVEIINTGNMYSGYWIEEDFNKMFPKLVWKNNFEFIHGNNKWYDAGIRNPDNYFVVRGIAHHPYNMFIDLYYLEDVDTGFEYLISRQGIKKITYNPNEEIVIDLDLLFS